MQTTINSDGNLVLSHLRHIAIRKSKMSLLVGYNYGFSNSDLLINKGKSWSLRFLHESILESIDFGIVLLFIRIARFDDHV